MTTPTTVEWVIAAVAASLVVIAGGMAIWALIGDRAKGRRRCPGCWYDVTGVPGLGCPECGRTQFEERDFFRTRRRGRFAALVIVLGCAPAIVWMGVAAQSGAWVRYAPISLLVAVVDPQKFTFNSLFDPASIELKSRISASPIWQWQSRLLIQRMMDGTGERLLHARKRWPRGESLAVSGSPGLGCFNGTPWESNVTARVRLLSTADGTPGEWCSSDSPYLFDFVSIGVPDAGTEPLRMEAELVWEGQTIWTGVEHLHVDRSLSAEQLLRPVSDATLSERMLKSLAPELSLLPAGHLLLVLNDWDRDKIFGRGVAIGLKIRVLRDGEVIGEAEHAARPILSGFYGNELRHSMVFISPMTFLDSKTMGGHWELELEGDWRVAIRDYDRYGHGHLTATPWREAKEYWAVKARLPLPVRGQ